MDDVFVLRRRDRYLATPPRETFYHDATAAEYETLERHFSFLHALCDEVKLLLAGPSLDGRYGVAIFTVTDAAEAADIVARDPAVREGVFTPNLHPLSVGIMRA